MTFEDWCSNNIDKRHTFEINTYIVDNANLQNMPGENISSSSVKASFNLLRDKCAAKQVDDSIWQELVDRNAEDETLTEETKQSSYHNNF